MSIKNIPSAKAADAVRLASPTRRDHPTPGQKPRMSIEAHGLAGSRQKTLQAFTPVHPSMVGNGNRGHAVSKSQQPAAPIVAHSTAGRPTPAPDIHSGAAGRGISGRDTPGAGGVVAHDTTLADRVLDEPMDRGLVNNKLHDAERHHSVSRDRLPAKPVDSKTTPQSLIDQFKRWNAGEG